MSQARLRLAFSGMHPDRVRVLTERFGSAEALVHAIEAGRVEVSTDVERRLEVPGPDRLDELDRLGVRVAFRGDGAFPERLGVLPDSPDALFVRGALPDGPVVAVVGTRRCTAYGRRLAYAYGRAIADAGWVLASGLARGIDGAAHRGTCDAGGAGIAVLGSGIDVVYPREHAELDGRLIAGGGAIVTEYPPGSRPEPWRFPPRNRIISGLSQAVVVVEAAVTGGALITAGTALTQGVPVLATPGDVDRETSRGTNLLIRDGAIPVLDPADLIEELALILGPPKRPPAVATETGIAEVTPDPAEIDQLVESTGRSVAEVLAQLGRNSAGSVEDPSAKDPAR